MKTRTLIIKTIIAIIILFVGFVAAQDPKKKTTQKKQDNKEQADSSLIRIQQNNIQLKEQKALIDSILIEKSK